MKNRELARTLYEMAELLEFHKVKWKPQAYRKVAREIDKLPRDIEEMYLEGKLDTIAGVGPKIASNIEEYLRTGHIRALKELRKKTPDFQREILQIPGIGPKKLERLQKELEIKSVTDLEKAAKNHQISKLPGFSVEAEREILHGLYWLQSRKKRWYWNEIEVNGE